MRKPVLGICYGLQSLNVWRTERSSRTCQMPLIIARDGPWLKLIGCKSSHIPGWRRFFARQEPYPTALR